MFLLIEQDVEEMDDEELTALFVEVFGDREKFFNMCIRELEKAEAIINLHMDQANSCSRDVVDEDSIECFEMPESREDKIQILLDLFKEKDLVTLTKYIKVFVQPKGKVLAVAHAKLNADFEKIFKKLKFRPDDDDIAHVKSFTKPDGDRMAGKGSMTATSCKIFKFSYFSRKFRENLLNLFNMNPEEHAEDDIVDEEIGVAQSQDHPTHVQSRTSNTLRLCSCCKFRTRNEMEFSNHMKEHSMCPECGLVFKNVTDLSHHHKSFHAKVDCSKCGKLILEVNLAKHMDGHLTENSYKKVVKRGKVSSKTESKDAKITAYRVFLKTKRPEVRDLNPDATPQQMIALLNNEWNKEKAAGGQDYWKQQADKVNATPDVTSVPVVIADPSTDASTSAQNANVSLSLTESESLVASNENLDMHAIKKCHLCGLMIANMAAHMQLAHEKDVLEENSEEIHVDDDEAISSFVEGDIVLVLRKSIHWPGRVLEKVTEKYAVKVYDKAGTIEVKKEKFLLPFSTDPSCCNGRSAAWVKAWKQAKLEYDAKA